MKTLPLILIPCLVCLLVACDEQPERDFSRPPEYRNSAAEYLLSEQAKTEQARRDARDSLTTLRREQAEARADSQLDAIPADFPLAFVTFPGAEWRSGNATGPLTMLRLEVSEPLASALERVKKAAALDGWTLEVVVGDETSPYSSFQKDARRVDVWMTPASESKTRVVATLTELERPPAAPAP